MTKKHGIMGGLESLGLVEGDNPLAEAQGQAPPAPQQAYPIYQAPAYTSSSTLNADDQDRLKALEAQVYATPSTYVIFQKLRQTIGGADGNVGKLFEILSVANPGVTPAKVLADIDTHLGVIHDKRQEFDAQITKAKADRIDGPTQQITEMQSQVATLNAKIAALQPSIQSAAASLTDANTRFSAVESQLTAPLLQAKSLVSSIA